MTLNKPSELPDDRTVLPPITAQRSFTFFNSLTEEETTIRFGDVVERVRSKNGESVSEGRWLVLDTAYGDYIIILFDLVKGSYTSYELDDLERMLSEGDSIQVHSDPFDYFG